LRTITFCPVRNVVSEKSTTAFGMRQSSGKNVHSSLLKLGHARGHRELLDHRPHAELLRDCLAEVDLVADDLASFRIDEAVGLIRSQHTDDQLTFFLDGLQLVRIGASHGGEGRGNAHRDGREQL
jgi:hypothetical protein